MGLAFLPLTLQLSPVLFHLEAVLLDLALLLVPLESEPLHLLVLLIALPFEPQTQLLALLLELPALRFQPASHLFPAPFAFLLTLVAQGFQLTVQLLELLTLLLTEPLPQLAGVAAHPLAGVLGQAPGFGLQPLDLLALRFHLPGQPSGLLPEPGGLRLAHTVAGETARLLGELSGPPGGTLRQMLDPRDGEISLELFEGLDLDLEILVEGLELDLQSLHLRLHLRFDQLFDVPVDRLQGLEGLCQQLGELRLELSQLPPCQLVGAVSR